MEFLFIQIWEDREQFLRDLIRIHHHLRIGIHRGCDKVGGQYFAIAIENILAVCQWLLAVGRGDAFARLIASPFYHHQDEEFHANTNEGEQEEAKQKHKARFGGIKPAIDGAAGVQVFAAIFFEGSGHAYSRILCFG